jgi:hypothetical protein
MVLHPLLEVFLILGGADAGIWTAGIGPIDAGLDGAIVLADGRRRRRSFLFLSAAAGERRRNGEQHKECRAKTEPGWRMRLHIGCDALKLAATENGEVVY